MHPAAPHALVMSLLVATAIGCPATPGTGSTPPPSEAALADPATPALPLPEGIEAARETITEAQLEAWTRAVSADRFAGRGPGTAGDADARTWLAEQLASFGYEPAGEGGGWEQPFSIVGVTAKMPEAWTFRGAKKSALNLRFGDELIAASGVQDPRVEVKDAELVFAGYGIVAPDENWDDYAGVDVRGKIVVLLNDDPDWNPELFGGERRLYYGRWTYKYEEAARQGAAGAIIVHTDASAGYPWSVVQTSWTGEQFGLPAGDEPRAPLHAWVTEDAARRLVALGGHDLPALVAAARRRGFAPVPLGVRTSFAFDAAIHRTETANVLGVLRGSDAARAAEHVVVTAHHDHLGTGQPDEDSDAIYNGARDNGTGIAQALAVAQGLGALPQPPARSVLVAFVGAEEQGLLGSKWLAEQALLLGPADALVANVNFELGNIWGPTTDVVIHGMGKNDLDTIVTAAAAMQDRRTRDEADPRSGWYYRSDQLSFARVGVPSVWFESGRDFVGKPAGWGEEHVSGWISEHYHQPSDEVRDDWQWGGLVQDARLGLLVTAAIAHAPSRPRWSPGDEFANVAR